MKHTTTRCILILALALVGMAQPRCTVTQKEADSSLLDWPRGLKVSTGHAVAFQISYPAGTPDKEVERCIQQISNSAVTQQYFKDWAETEYSNADVSRLWEIYIGDKLICFVGKPKGGKQ